MPLPDGEGMKAFHKLQEDILRQTGDESLFARSRKYDVLAHYRLYFANCCDIECGDALPDELSRSLF